MLSAISKFFLSVLNQFPGLIIGWVTAVLLGLNKIIFSEMKRVARHRLNVAIEVHKIVNEASSSGYKILPRGPEHVNITITDLDGVDSEMGVIFNSFVNLWNRIGEQFGDKNKGVEQTKNYIEMTNQEDVYRVKLTNWTNKIRSGKGLKNIFINSLGL